MRKWEYQITRYQLKSLAKGGELSREAFYCDDKGKCFIHDTSEAATDIIREVFNEEGKSGWELAQFGYHRGELLCVWKRTVD